MDWKFLLVRILIVDLVFRFHKCPLFSRRSFDSSECVPVTRPCPIAAPYSLAQTMGRPQASIAELLFVCEDIIVPGMHSRACLSVTGATDRSELTEIDGLLCHVHMQQEGYCFT